MTTIKQSAKEAIEWYSKNRYIYDALCKRIKSLIESILEKEKIPYHSITYRAKDIESFSVKCNKDKYSNPVKEIMDKAGVRIITYFDSDVQRISNLIEKEFNIDYANSINKSKLLEVNQVGYRSVHYIAKLSEERVKLAEYAVFSNLECEIQVRTILQHSWAEIEHDRNYKFNGVLPDEIKRRFFLLSGVLELADREFQAISIEIDNYAKKVEELTQKGEIDEIPINSTSINEFMSNKFDNLIKYNSSSDNEIIIEELDKFGIKSLADIDKIIPQNYLENALEVYGKESASYTSILRDIMMIKDIKLYFEKSWQFHWSEIDKSSIYLISLYDVPIHEMLIEYEIKIEYENEFEFEYENNYEEIYEDQY